MTDGKRVVTTSLPAELAQRLDEIAARIDRSKSWIMRQALAEWLAEEQRRYELTLEALKDVDEGRLLSHDEVSEWLAARRKSRDITE